MSKFDSIYVDSLDVLSRYGVDKTFFETSAGRQLVNSLALVHAEDKTTFNDANELAGALLDGMVAVYKEQKIADGLGSFLSTPDGRLISTINASQDGLQETILEYVVNAKGKEVMDIYNEIFNKIGLHCPSCSCESRIVDYEELIELRESFLDKLEEILGSD